MEPSRRAGERLYFCECRPATLCQLPRPRLWLYITLNHSRAVQPKCTRPKPCTTTGIYGSSKSNAMTHGRTEQDLPKLSQRLSKLCQFPCIFEATTCGSDPPRLCPSFHSARTSALVPRCKCRRVDTPQHHLQRILAAASFPTSMSPCRVQEMCSLCYP